MGQVMSTMYVSFQQPWMLERVGNTKGTKANTKVESGGKVVSSGVCMSDPWTRKPPF